MSRGDETKVRMLVLEPQETKFVSRLVMFFLLFFVAVTISTLLRMAGSASRGALLGIIMYLVFASIIGALLLFSLGKIRARERAAKELASSCTAADNRIILPAELEFEYGRLDVRMLPRRKRSTKEFRVEGRGKAESVPFMDREFRLMITSEGEGLASFPAVRILSRPYEGVMLLFMTDTGTVVCRKSLNIPTPEGSVHLDVEGRGKKLIGRIYSTPEKTERVRVLLGIPEMEVEVAGGAIKEFEYSMLPEQKTVVYTSYGALSLVGIARKLGMKGAVLGHGEFLIRFAVEGRLKRRYSDRESFKVLMEESTWGI